MSYLLGQFFDVPVMPLSNLDHTGSQTCGGPIWPSWNTRVVERFCRNGLPADQCPPAAPATTIVDLGEAFWGGLVDPHFGHQIADNFTRILPSRHVDPKAKFLFSSGERPISSWFWDMLQWCNVERQDVLIVRRPVLAKRLRVVAQPEQLWKAEPPTHDHLDALDRFIHAKEKIPVEPGKFVYVSRAGLETSKAHMAGEAYLEHCIRQAGGIVFRPETTSIEEQMRLYRSVGTLLFSEGSALHLLQLAGRNFHNIHVIRRHPGDTLFAGLLTPRCKHYRSTDITRQLIAGLNRSGQPENHAALSIVEPRLLVEELLLAGCDVRPWFHTQEFSKAVTEDVITWLRWKLSTRRQPNWRQSFANIAAGLKAAGAAQLAEQVLAYTHQDSPA